MTGVQTCALPIFGLAGCDACAAPPSEDRARPTEVTRGTEVPLDRGPAVALREAPLDPSDTDAFEVVDLALAERAERARSWAARDVLATSPDVVARRSVGNWLCRLETRFGPPREISAAGCRYALRDRTTTYVVTAYADASGPALGGVLHDGARPIDLETMVRVVDRPAALLDATVPDDCELALKRGARVVGVRGGEWFSE